MSQRLTPELIRRAIDKVTLNRALMFFIAVAGGGFFFDSFDIVIVSYALPLIKQDLIWQDGADRPGAGGGVCAGAHPRPRQRDAAAVLADRDFCRGWSRIVDRAQLWLALAVRAGCAAGDPGLLHPPRLAGIPSLACRSGSPSRCQGVAGICRRQRCNDQAGSG